MALGAQDMQAPHRHHLVVLPVGILLMPGIGFPILGPGFQHGGVGGFRVAGGLLQQFRSHALVQKIPPGQKLRVAAQEDVRAAACHVGGDGNAAQLACLGHDLRLTGVLLGVEHHVVDAPALEHIGKQLALFHRNGTHQDGLAGLMHRGDLLHHRPELARLGGVHHVVVVDPLQGHIGGHFHHVQVVDGLELLLLGLGGTRHARQLFIHAEIVLEGDGGQGLVFPLHLDPFLGL